LREPTAEAHRRLIAGAEPGLPFIIATGHGGRGSLPAELAFAPGIRKPHPGDLIQRTFGKPKPGAAVRRGRVR
jgi:hypothetical protein